MKTSMRLCLAGVAFVSLLGCQMNRPETGSPDFAEIRIESHPQGWGYAHKTVKPDGSIIGGHLSGGAGAPRVFESKLQVTPEDMSTLKTLVAKVAAEPAKDRVPPPDQKREGYISVVISLGDGTSTAVLAKGDQRFQSETFQAIWDVVSKYRAGAW